MHSYGRLTQALDRDVLAIAQKLINDETSALPRVSEIHNHIIRSNSSLKRRPHQQLQASIERVLKAIESDRSEPDIDQVELGERTMNRRLTMNWATSAHNSDETNTITEANKRSSIADRSPNKRLKPNQTTRAAWAPPSLSDFSRVGGIDDAINAMLSEIERPLTEVPTLNDSEFRPPPAYLVHGPSGCGKTTLVRYLAARVGTNLVSFLAKSVISNIAGESEKNLKKYFDEAKSVSPCILFIDKVEKICLKRGNDRSTDSSLSDELIDCIDDLRRYNFGGRQVVLIAATSMPNNIEPELIRAGRFAREIAIPIPNVIRREAMLAAHIQNTSVDGQLDARQLAKRTSHYIAFDIEDLIDTIINRKKTINWCGGTAGVEQRSSPVTQELIEFALHKTRPTTTKSGYAEVPDILSEDIGGLHDAKEKLNLAIISRITKPEAWASLGKRRDTAGVLLYGPPGCGKTMLAMWVANACGANFISVKSSDLISKFLGDSERALSDVFKRAWNARPCLIFFDEIDSIASKRTGESMESLNRIVNTFLVEMDGITKRESVYVIGATNRDGLIDPALLRSGRLETKIFVGLPTEEERVDIMKTQCRNARVDFSDSIAAIARKCNDFSGADLDVLLRQAQTVAFKRREEEKSGVEPEGITVLDWEKAFEQARPSVPLEQRRRQDDPGS